MKSIDRFNIDHAKVDGARLHNDLNKLVDATNANFVQQSTLLLTASLTIKNQKAQIDNLAARIAALEKANAS